MDFVVKGCAIFFLKYLKNKNRVKVGSVGIMRIYQLYIEGCKNIFFHSGLHFIIIRIFILQNAFHLDQHFIFILAFILFSFGLHPSDWFSFESSFFSL